MDHTPFIIAAFSLTLVATVWLSVSSYVAMRRAEALARDLSETR